MTDTSQTLVLLCSQPKPVTFTLQELVEISGGELIGDSALEITGAASLAEATDGEISFFGNRKYISMLRKVNKVARQPLTTSNYFAGGHRIRID